MKIVEKKQWPCRTTTLAGQSEIEVIFWHSVINICKDTLKITDIYALKT